MTASIDRQAPKLMSNLVILPADVSNVSTTATTNVRGPSCERAIVFDDAAVPVAEPCSMSKVNPTNAEWT